VKYWYDTEFIENGHTIDLISIGVVAEDGRELYLQSCQFDPRSASGWVSEHVIPQLEICPHSTGGYAASFFQHKEGQCLRSVPVLGFNPDCPWRTRQQIRSELLSFCDATRYGTPEFWGYYSAYDHIALCQLFGSMVNLPPGWPMYTRDLKQLADSLGNPDLPRQEKRQHHALADARWQRDCYIFLLEYAKQKKPWLPAQADYDDRCSAEPMSSIGTPGVSLGSVFAHYVAYNGMHLLALILGKNEQSDLVDLVLYTSLPNVTGQKNFGTQFHQNVRYSQTGEPGTWHYLEEATTV
jgi:hypothetical protein